MWMRVRPCREGEVSEKVIGSDGSVFDLGGILEPIEDPEDFPPVTPDQPVRGEVGTLTGPPIIGTTDSVNAGPAKRAG